MYYVYFCRLSSLTNDKNIVNYMSQFTPETVVPDIDTIKFIAADRATSYPLTHLDSSLSKLKPLKKQYDLKRKEHITAATAAVATDDTTIDLDTSKIKCFSGDVITDRGNEEDKEQAEFDSLRISSKEYTGFTKIGPDLYSKISNPCFICNESAVSFYTRYNTKK
jgi:hypothetical protein